MSSGAVEPSPVSGAPRGGRDLVLGDGRGRGGRWWDDGARVPVHDRLVHPTAAAGRRVCRAAPRALPEVVLARDPVLVGVELRRVAGVRPQDRLGGGLAREVTAVATGRLGGRDPGEREGGDRGEDRGGEHGADAHRGGDSSDRAVRAPKE